MTQADVDAFTELELAALRRILARARRMYTGKIAQSTGFAFAMYVLDAYATETDSDYCRACAGVLMGEHVCGGDA